jgi:hypothetical protein
MSWPGTDPCHCQAPQGLPVLTSWRACGHLAAAAQSSNSYCLKTMPLAVYFCLKWQKSYQLAQWTPEVFKQYQFLHYPSAFPHPYLSFCNMSKQHLQRSTVHTVFAVHILFCACGKFSTVLHDPQRCLEWPTPRLHAQIYSLNSIIRSPMTSEFWTELRRGPNYRVKTVLVIEL